MKKHTKIYAGFEVLFFWSAVDSVPLGYEDNPVTRCRSQGNGVHNRRAAF
jgi:hypothetical protein